MSMFSVYIHDNVSCSNFVFTVNICLSKKSREINYIDYIHTKLFNGEFIFNIIMEII